MQTFKKTLSAAEIAAARSAERRRAVCKAFLEKHGLKFDKFTVVGHDSFIGFVTELFMKKYLTVQYADQIVCIEAWEDQYDATEIDAVLAKAYPTGGEIHLVCKYFYDAWDLRIVKKEGPLLLLDIKTAITAKTPSPYWNFMYPVVQAHKTGKDQKDQMALVYYVVTDPQNPETLKELVIIGATHEDTIKKCELIPKGSVTKFGTISQTDNYETLLSKHYHDLALLFQ